MKPESLAIITARGGSKRIPGKNIKDFLGKPILAYPIAAALESGCFAEVMVSTDDASIAAIARACGAEVPFLRAAETSGDFVGTEVVISEVLGQYGELGRTFEFACCLYPTAPFVTPAKLRQGWELLRKGDASSVVPVARFSYPIQRALYIEAGFLKMMWPEHLNARSQDLPAVYHDAGQFYWFRVSDFLRDKNIFGSRAMPLIVPETEVQDIDTETDWHIAAMKYEYMQNKRDKLL